VRDGQGGAVFVAGLGEAAVDVLKRSKSLAAHPAAATGTPPQRPHRQQPTTRNQHEKPEEIEDLKATPHGLRTKLYGIR
jgi:hypothetical protein